MNTLLKRSIAAFAFTAALATLAPAQAAEPTSESNITVKFRDLDLAKAEGVATLYQRIERSARLVCTDSSSPYDAGRVQTFERCYQAAIQDAVASINQPQLTALHRAKTEKPVQVGSAK
ncbi:MAG TPA: UrcA family protein [Steroidobacteraceae bacterium]|jgi:UrcA family protein|nr:UrcA family protein [Steroidobacteraceae bacterium]